MAEEKQGRMLSSKFIVSMMLRKVGIMEPEPRGNLSGNVNEIVIEI